jgi:hypothetical protein
MFYFQRWTSGFNKDKYKKRVDEGLNYVLDNLESLVHWEEMYNRECDNINGKTHRELLNMIKIYVNNERSGNIK